MMRNKALQGANHEICRRSVEAQYPQAWQLKTMKIDSQVHERNFYLQTSTHGGRRLTSTMGDFVEDGTQLLDFGVLTLHLSCKSLHSIGTIQARR
jgi:hypothetical protein